MAKKGVLKSLEKRLNDKTKADKPLRTMSRFYIRIPQGKAKTARTDSRCGFCGYVALSQPSNCTFVLTSMSFTYVPRSRY